MLQEGRRTMSKEPLVSRVLYNFLPTEVEGFDSLGELALDMPWAWNHAAGAVLEHARHFMEETGQ